MALDDVKSWAQVSRVLPSTVQDNVSAPVRVSRYGEYIVQTLTGNKLHGLADEGKYFVATNPTPGTGVDGHAAPSDITVDTKPHVFIRNDASASTDSRLYLDFIRLQVTAAGAGATTALWCAKMDTGATRYSSGGTEITEVNANMASTASSSAKIYHGAVVAAAATTSQRILGSGLLRTVVPVVGDTYLFTFGQPAPSVSSMIVGSTAIANIVVPMPPVVLGPADQFLLHLAGASQSGAHSYEITLGFWER